jgi:hypothetical protein
MPVIRCLLLALGLAATAAQAGTRVLPPGAVLFDSATPKADTARIALATGEIVARVEAGDPDGAVARLQAIEGALQFELTAARVIEALQAQPRKSGDRFLAALEQTPVRVFHRHDETAADWFLPLIDVAARAKSARRVIDANAARDRAVSALLADPATAGSLDAQAVAAAIAVLPAPKADALAARVAHGDLVLAGRPLVQLALRTSRTPVWMQALEQADEVDVLPLFATVDSILPGADALDWLQRAAKDGRYKSAAVMAVGRMATHSILASRALDAYLGRADTGASAAAALVEHGSANFVDDIERRLAATRDPVRVQHLALALRLADTPDARKRLHALEDDPRLSASAKAELQR